MIFLFNDTAIRNAAKYGHLEVVKLLLQDNRVDPSANDNYGIWMEIEIILYSPSYCYIN